MRLVEIRTDDEGRQYMALQGQTDTEAMEMRRKYREARDIRAAKIFKEALDNE